MLALLLLQSTAVPVQTIDSPIPARSCPSEIDPDEIVVCASRDPERYRLRPIPERYVEKPAFDIDLPGGGTIEPRVEQGRLGDPQVKVSLKLPF